MKDAIARLARLRHCIAEEENMLAGAEAALRTTAQWAAVDHRRGQLQSMRADQAKAEAEIRRQALTAYRETGDKAPHPAIKIKDFTVLDYNDGEALDYARVYIPRAVKLVKRKFEQAAKVLEPDFVTITKEPRATIARDLSEYLPEN